MLSSSRVFLIHHIACDPNKYKHGFPATTVPQRGFFFFCLFILAFSLMWTMAAYLLTIFPRLPSRPEGRAPSPMQLGTQCGPAEWFLTRKNKTRRDRPPPGFPLPSHPLTRFSHTRDLLLAFSPLPLQGVPRRSPNITRFHSTDCQPEDIGRHETTFLRGGYPA